MEKHDAAIMLETLVCSAYGLERYDLGGLVDSDHFARHPLDAAFLMLAPHLSPSSQDSIGGFLSKWTNEFRESSHVEESLIVDFVESLESLLYDLCD